MVARTELSAVQKDGISALDELKSTDKLISESLKAELDRLREELAFVSNERESQKTQLIDALLAKDKFRKDAEEAKELQETAALSSANQDSSEAAKKAAEKIEKLRDRLIERKQVSSANFLVHQHAMPVWCRSWHGRNVHLGDFALKKKGPGCNRTAANLFESNSKKLSKIRLICRENSKLCRVASLPRLKRYVHSNRACLTLL